jgi:hypothetical protein
MRFALTSTDGGAEIENLQNNPTISPARLHSLSLDRKQKQQAAHAAAQRENQMLR